MRCPWCSADDDRVVDSRPAEAGGAIRRRRHCNACGRRYTTFERVEDVGLVVIKRDGSKDPFDREKVAGSVRKAIKNRPVTPEQVERLVDRVQERMRRKGPEVTSEQVGVRRPRGSGAARSGRLHPLRERLQGLPGTLRLPAGAGLAAEEGAREAPDAEPSVIRRETLDVVGEQISGHMMLTNAPSRFTIRELRE